MEPLTTTTSLVAVATTLHTNPNHPFCYFYYRVNVRLIEDDTQLPTKPMVALRVGDLCV